MRNWKETGSGIKEIDWDEKNVEVDGREREREKSSVPVLLTIPFSRFTFLDSLFNSFLPHVNWVAKREKEE